MYIMYGMEYRIEVGEMAPDFSLLVFDGKELKKVSLHDYRAGGKRFRCEHTVGRHG